MESLPTEVKIQLFTCLSDLSAIKNLSQTSIAFNKAFMSSKDCIVREVVKSLLDPELLQEVTAVAKSLHMKPWSRDAISRILDDCFPSRPTLAAINWDFSTSVTIFKLQSVVRSLSTDFASVALSKECLTNRNGNSGPPPTKSELRRFERNFWKFELYCTFFRSREPYGTFPTEDRVEPEEQITIFFDRFAPFENEQLGCIHDFLWDQISPGFNDIAAHDINWAAEWEVYWVDDYYLGQAGWKEHLLSRGLVIIDKLRNAQTYLERFSLVQDDSSCPLFDNDFLVQGLSIGEERDRILVTAQDLHDMSLEQAEIAVKKSSCSELDEGPFEAWRWAYDENWLSFCYFTSANWIFRQRAFVMWDKFRLDHWELFETRRTNLPAEYDNAYATPSDLREEQQRSITARSEIYDNGGTGWWSFDDDSQVKWPKSHFKRR